MEIEYELTADDLLIFNAYTLKHNPDFRRNFLLWRFGFTWIIPLVWAMHSIDKNPDINVKPWFELSVTGFYLTWILLYPLYKQYIFKKHFTKILNELKIKLKNTTRKVTLKPEGIMTFSAGGETKTNWNMVEKIVTTDQYSYIYADPTCALIIPKRAFPDEAKCREFIETAKKYHADAAREK